MKGNNFVGITLNSANQDIFIIRNSIFKSLTQNLPKLKGSLLDVGCGKMPYKNYILAQSDVTDYVGLDIEQALVYDAEISPDYTWDGVTMPFEDDRFDCVIATEVLEHCPEPEVVLNEVFRVLKPQGVLFFTVPFLWNLHEVPHDEYRYTPFSLQRHLCNSGFETIEIKATGGWHAAMAQMLGLWVRRSPMAKKKRRILSALTLPIIKWLIRKENLKKVVFKEGQMITGLTGTAIKKG